MIIPLAKILEHVNDDTHAALRRLHALYRYHRNTADNEATDMFERESHAEKAREYQKMIDQLEEN